VYTLGTQRADITPPSTDARATVREQWTSVAFRTIHADGVEGASSAHMAAWSLSPASRQ
jgi:hypothetical protein